MKAALLLLTLICASFQLHATEPLCGAVKELIKIKKESHTEYTILWAEPAPSDALLCLSSKESKENVILRVPIVIERSLRPIEYPQGYDPFDLKKLEEMPDRKVETLSRISAETVILNRAIIYVNPMCSASLEELESYYIHKTKSEPDEGDKD